MALLAACSPPTITLPVYKGSRCQLRWPLTPHDEAAIVERSRMVVSWRAGVVAHHLNLAPAPSTDVQLPGVTKVVPVRAAPMDDLQPLLSQLFLRLQFRAGEMHAECKV